MDYFGFGRTDPFSDPVSYLPSTTTYQTVPVNTSSQPLVSTISQPVAPLSAAAPLSQYSSFY